VSQPAQAGRFLRLAESGRRRILLTVGERRIEALEGDSLLTALLLAGPHLRQSEFGDGPRAGFCLMGACQDCWVSLSDGRRVRACTTPAEDGMALEEIR
jgi:predicted molibdopterin-dependent oxidoreductase YjgC